MEPGQAAKESAFRYAARFPDRGGSRTLTGSSDRLELAADVPLSLAMPRPAELASRCTPPTLSALVERFDIEPFPDFSAK